MRAFGGHDYLLFLSLESRQRMPAPTRMTLMSMRTSLETVGNDSPPVLPTPRLTPRIFSEDSLHEYQHLTEVKRRNPDAQPYGTPFLDSLRFVDKGFSFFTKRDFLFAVKAGLLTCLVALPSVIRSSAHFFYYNRDE